VYEKVARFAVGHMPVCRPLPNITATRLLQRYLTIQGIGICLNWISCCNGGLSSGSASKQADCVGILLSSDSYNSETI